MKKLLLISLWFLSFASQGQMISKPWMKTHLTVVSQGRTNGYTIPSYLNLVKYNSAHRQLHHASVWADLDVFYIMANDGGQDYARLNHKDPTVYLMTLVNSPTFTSNVGFASNGTTSYEDLNWAPSNGVNFTQNDASWFVHIVDNVQGAFAFGTDDGASNTRRTYIQPRNALDRRLFSLNATAATPATVVTDGHGFHYMERTSSTLWALYTENVLASNSSTTSAARSTKTVYVNAFHAFDGSVSSWYTGNVAMIGFGKSMNSTKRTALFNALKGYFASL